MVKSNVKIEELTITLFYDRLHYGRNNCNCAIRYKKCRYIKISNLTLKNLLPVSISPAGRNSFWIVLKWKVNQPLLIADSRCFLNRKLVPVKGPLFKITDEVQNCIYGGKKVFTTVWRAEVGALRS